ncbi:MAG: hypothetical protein AB1346_09620 [Thermodesulfobacteriota bacterium]
MIPTRSIRTFLFPLLLPLLFPASAGALDGYAVYEGTAAIVNKEVLFLSDVHRERCFLRCAAMAGSRPEELSIGEARDRLISDTLALQEQEKLQLGQVDNAALAEAAREAAGRTEACASPCREGISRRQVSDWVKRQLLVREFLKQRVGAFIDVKEDEVRREYQRRLVQGDAAPGLTEGKVREELLAEKIDREIRNWYSRAASKSSITLSPLEEK